MKYNINQKIEVEFDPQNSEFSRRFSVAVGKIRRLYDKYEKDNAELIKRAAHTKLFDVRVSADREICALIDGLFNAPVSAAVFEGDSLSQDIDTGKPCWWVLLRAMAGYIKSPLSRKCRKILKG